MLEVRLPPLRREQLVLWRGFRRFNAWVAHRRFGKTVLCLEILLKSALESTHHLPRYAYFGPQRAQAKDIAWAYLQQFVAEIPQVVINQADLSVTFAHNGAQVRLYGADNHGLGRSRRGIYLDGVAIDEYADISPVVWRQVLRPMLIDRQGWAVFIGTPRGKNHFWSLYQQACHSPNWSAALLRADQTRIIAPDELALLREEALAEDRLADYEQEMLCSWDTPMPGAVYADQLRRLDVEARITRLVPHPAYPVQTAWDIGPVHNAIWYFQVLPDRVHFLEYEEQPGDLPKHIETVRSKPYVYNASLVLPPMSRGPMETHYGPHDLETGKDYSSSKSRLGIAAAHHFRFTVLARGAVEDRIEAGRVLMGKSYFDALKCEDGLNALRNYRYELDEIRQVYTKTPVRDWASHGADSFGYAAIGIGQVGTRPRLPTAIPGSFEYLSQELKRRGRGKIRAFAIG